MNNNENIIVDSGATSIFGAVSNMFVKTGAKSDKTVFLPDATTVTTTVKAILPNHGLPKEAR